MASSVAVVGAGPSSLIVLDRLATQLESNSQASVNAIHIFDPAPAGCGVHCKDAAPYLLTNTICSQITVFDEKSKTGSSFFDWARHQPHDTIRSWGLSGPIEPDRCLPRRALGDYLSWAFGVIRGRLYSLTNLYFHSVFVRDVVPLDDGQHYAILSSSVNVVVEAVVVATGHGLRSSPCRSRSQDKLGSAPSPRVLIQGLGLTAIDRLMDLTLGVGGRFERGRGPEPTYVRSGSEAAIFMASRSGLPYAARARNQKSGDWRYTPTFFTRTEIDRLRQAKAGNGSGTTGKLDFELDIFPRLKLEMEKAFYEAAVRVRHGQDAAARFGRTSPACAPTKRCYRTNSPP